MCGSLSILFGVSIDGNVFRYGSASVLIGVSSEGMRLCLGQCLYSLMSVLKGMCTVYWSVSVHIGVSTEVNVLSVQARCVKQR